MAQDRQMCGLAGELFVAAELLKRKFQTSVTFGNAKAIDLFTHNSKTGRTFAIQVKTLRGRNYFFLGREDVKSDSIYIFVILNKPGKPVQYFVVPGQDLSDTPERFGKGFAHPKIPGIHPKRLEELGYEDSWSAFEKS